MNRLFYRSHVKGYQGWCFCTWRNMSEIDLRIAGVQTGFFRLMRNPFKEFHGAFYENERTGEIKILPMINY